MGPGIKLLTLRGYCEFSGDIREGGREDFLTVPGVALFTQLNLIALCSVMHF